MEEKFITDDGTELIVTSNRHRSQSTTTKLIGGREVFDHDNFDFHALRPVDNLMLRWNKVVRLGVQIMSTLRFVLSVASITIICNQVSSRFSQDLIDQLGSTTFLALSYFAQFAGIPFITLILYQFNNFFAEMVYYKYLRQGAIIDFPNTTSKAFLCSNKTAILFVVCFTSYSLFILAVLLVLRATLGEFLLALSAMVGVSVFWYQQQGIEDKLISLTEYIQSFPDETGQYDNIDRTSLAAASKALQTMTLLEGRKPCYHDYWRSSYFKSIFAETKIRIGMGFAVRSFVLFAILLVMLYVFVITTSHNSSSWATAVNPCVKMCVFDDALQYHVAEKCSRCLCGCLKELNMASGLCTCTTRFVTPNCTLQTMGKAFCNCPDLSGQCL